MKNKNYIFGNKIAIYRKMKKLTQGQLAEKLNVTNQAISKWENGVCKELKMDLNDVIEILLNM